MFVGGAVHDWTLVGVGFVLFGLWFLRSEIRYDRKMKAEYAALLARQAEDEAQPKNASASA